MCQVADHTADGVLARDELQQAKKALERVAKEKGAEWLKVSNLTVLVIWNSMIIQ